MHFGCYGECEESAHIGTFGDGRDLTPERWTFHWSDDGEVPLNVWGRGRSIHCLKQKRIRTLLLLASMTAAGVIFATVNCAPREPLLTAGGCYRGDWPEGGTIQLDLFYRENNPEIWLTFEDQGEPDGVMVSINTPGGFLGRIRKPHTEDASPKADILCHFKGDRDVILGELRLTSNAAPRPFKLTRVFSHQSTSAKSGFFLNDRANTRKTFHGKHPVFTDTSPFHAELNRAICQEVRQSADEFTSGAISHLREAIRWHYPVGTYWSNDQLWQIRLLTDSVASFAVWNHPEHGSCGNSTYWKAHNYRWRDGTLAEFHLANLFRKDTNWKEALLERSELRLREAFFAPGADGNHIGPDTSLEIFTLSLSGLQIYINPYIIGSGAEGSFVIHIPFTDLKPFLDPQGPVGALPFVTSLSSSPVVSR